MLRAMLCCAVITLSTPALAIEGIETGKAPPSFNLPDIGGGTVALEDLRGRTAVLLFWSTWSPRSIEMLEDFKGYHSRYGSDDLRIVAINADHEHLTDKERDTIKYFATGLELPFPVLLDVGLGSYAAYGIEALPSAVVLDPRGKVSYSLGGYPLFSYREELRDAFLLAMGRPPEGGDLQVASTVFPEEEAAPDPVPAKTACALPRSRYCLLSAEREGGETDPAVMALRLALCRGDVAEAEKMIRGIGSAHLETNELRFALAHLMLLKGRAMAARGAFASIADGHPDESWGSWGLGLVALAEGRADEAIVHLERAVRSGAVNAEAETAVLNYLLGFWNEGRRAPGEEKFLSLFSTLTPIRDCFRNSDAT